MAGNAIRPELLELLERPKTKRDGTVVTKTKKGGKEEVVTRPIEADEVLSHRVRGDVVVVATTDGQKFQAEIPKAVQKKLASDAGEAPAGAGSGQNEGG